MKFSTRVSDAVHILAFIALNRNEALTSQRIAESIRTNPGCVRQLMGSLRRYGIMTSVQGHAKPALSRAPADISLLDIYRAVEGGKPLLHLDTHTNPECGVGVNIQLALQIATRKSSGSFPQGMRPHGKDTWQQKSPESHRQNPDRQKAAPETHIPALSAEFIPSIFFHFRAWQGRLIN